MKKLLFVLFFSLVCCQSEIYLEDGIIKCQEDVSVGFVGEIDGVSYKVVDSLILKTMIKNSEDLRFICTTKITDMGSMFNSSEFNGDISKWDVSNITNMNGMFFNSKFNGDISKWDVSNVLSCEGFSDNNLQWTLPQPKFTNCDTKNREPDFHDDLEYYN